LPGAVTLTLRFLLDIIAPLDPDADEAHGGGAGEGQQQ